MTDSVSIAPVIPLNFQVPTLQSTSKHILRNRLEEVNTLTSQSSYSFSTNSQMEFLINSASDFIDWSKSYLRFQLTCTASLDGSNDTAKALCKGGAHALFREIRLETSNGVVIQRLPRYNKWYALMSQAMPQEQVERVGRFHGDSIVDTTQTVDGVASVSAARRLYANTSAIIVCMQPLVPFFYANGICPIALYRGGIKVVFVLENPAYSLRTGYSTAVGGGSDAFTAFDFTIANPRYVVNFLQPSQEVMGSYLSLYNSGQLNYVYPSYLFYGNQVASGSSSGVDLQMTPSVRSARAVFSVQQQPCAETVIGGTITADNGKLGSTYCVDTIGQFLKGNCSSYKYNSGALNFPLNAGVVMTSIDDGEALQEFRRALGLQGSSAPMRDHPYWFQEINTTTIVNGVAEASTLCLAAKLGRGDDYYSGLDLSIVPIVFNLGRDAAFQYTGTDGNNTNGVLYTLSWIEHDSILTLSNAGCQIRT